MTHFNGIVRDISKNNREPDWLVDLRLSALEAFEKTPPPAKNEEEWRKVDLNQILFSDLQVYSDASPKISLLSDAPHGVFAGTLSQAVKDIPDKVRPCLERSLAHNVRKYDALVNALWNGGVFVHVPENLQADLPISMSLKPQAGQSGGVRPAYFPKRHIVLEKNSSLTLVSEEISNEGWGGWIGSQTEIILKAGAKLSLVRTQLADRKSTLVSSLYSTLERDASLNFIVVSAGSALNKSNWSADIVGEGASACVFGLVKGEGTQNFDHSVLLTHQAPHSSSNVLFKTAMKDKSRSLFTGLIHVWKAAQKTAAYQTNRNLLLSREARADTLPKLEIEADDVKCGHGAAVSNVDPDQIYYLMTRGLSREAAQSIILEGFYEDVLGKFLENLNSAGAPKIKEEL
jgi:Fe-S cluster assembly protein SufD